MRESVRRFFHWQYSQVFIGLLFAAGCTLIGLHRFYPAYVCFAVFGLWAVAYWLCSDTLKEKYRAVYELQIRQNYKIRGTCDMYMRANDKYLALKFGVSLLLLCLSVLCMAYVRFEQIDYELGLLFGRLYPANDANPGACSPNEDEIAIYEGGLSTVIAIYELPVGLVHVGNQHVIDVDKARDGSLVLLADIRDKDNKVIVRFDHEGFQVNPNNYFQMKRPDRSTLIVIDQQGTEVVNARYLNKTSLRVWAHFYALGRLVDLSATNVGNISFSGANCLKLQPATHDHPDLSIFGIQ